MIRLHGTLAFEVRLDEQLVQPVEFGPVGHLGQRILRGPLVQGLALLLERGLARGVVQQHRGAAHRAVGTDHGHRVHVDGHGLLLRLAPAGGAATARRWPARTPPGIRSWSSRSCFSSRMPISVGDQLRSSTLAAGDAGESLGARFHSVICMLLFDEDHGVVHVVQQPLLKHVLADATLGGLGLARPTPRQNRFACAASSVLSQWLTTLRCSWTAISQLGERLDQLGIELRAGVAEQLVQCPLARHGVAIDLVGGHRVEGVDDRQHPGAQRNLVPTSEYSGARSVVPSARVAHDFQTPGDRSSPTRIFEAGEAVLIHQVQLRRGERAGLEQQAVGAPILPISCSRAATSSSSRCSAQAVGKAQDEQPSATRSEWAAAGACL